MLGFAPGPGVLVHRQAEPGGTAAQAPLDAGFELLGSLDQDAGGTRTGGALGMATEHELADAAAVPVRPRAETTGGEAGQRLGQLLEQVVVGKVWVGLAHPDMAHAGPVPREHGPGLTGAPRRPPAHSAA